jgi:beta-carotene hydroxylase
MVKAHKTLRILMTASIGYTTPESVRANLAKVDPTGVKAIVVNPTVDSVDSTVDLATLTATSIKLEEGPMLSSAINRVKGECGVMSEAKLPLMVPRDLLGAPKEFWNPNLLMFLAAVMIALASTAGYFGLHWPGWISFLMNFVAFHMVGTVIHDASHGAAHSDRRINAALGHGSAFMLFFSFPVFTRVHQQHHAHVNDPKNDPDHIVSTFGPLWFINARFLYHEVFFFQRKLWRKNELWEWVAARAVAVVIILLGWQFGFLNYILNFWFSPLAIVGLLLGLFFDYLPHRPFKERDRWLNSRIYPSKLLNLLIGGQNYHLVHHLWPSIPWYKYEAAYYEMKPLLDAKNSPQQLGILDSPQDFWGFVYDTFIGIRFSHHGQSADNAATATPPSIAEVVAIKEAKLEPVNDSVVTPMMQKSLDRQSA